MKLNPRRRWRLEHLWPLLLLFVAALYLAPTTKSMRNLYYLAVLLPALVLVRREDLQLLWRNPVLRAATLLLGYLWLSCLWSSDTRVALVAKAAERLLYLLAFLLVASRCLASQQRRGDLLRVLVTAAMLGAGLSLWQFWDHWHTRTLAGWWWRVRPEFWGSGHHPIIGASLYGVATVAAYLGSRRSAGWWRLAWGLCGALLMLLVLRSYSRGPILATSGALLAAALLYRDRKTLALVGVAAVGAVAWLWLGDQDLGSMLARGTAQRPQIWLHVLHDTAGAPLFGHGLLTNESFHLDYPDGKSWSIDHPHSLFVATLFYGGLAGLLLLLLLLASALWRAHRQGAKAVLVLLLLAMALGVTDNNKLLVSPNPLWLYFWLPIALAAAGSSPARQPKQAP